MTRTITLAKGGRRYVFRCSGNIDPQLVDKLIVSAKAAVRSATICWRPPVKNLYE
jgi:hypothetical protein